MLQHSRQSLSLLVVASRFATGRQSKSAFLVFLRYLRPEMSLHLLGIALFRIDGASLLHYPAKQDKVAVKRLRSGF
jgi:hypothetical protein